MKNYLQKLNDTFSYILSLEKSWDDEGAYPVNKKAYTRTNEFLFKLINDIGEFEMPSINLCNDGSVDLSFDKGKTRLLINISENRIGWYGDLGNNEDSIKHSQVELYNKDLFDWINTKLK